MAAEGGNSVLEHFVHSMDSARMLTEFSRMQKWLIVGEAGDGKSSLVNALCGRDVSVVGNAAEGVTKAVQFFPSSCKRYLLVDTPGIGDMDIQPATLIAMLEDALKSVEIHGVIICSKNYTRISLGAGLVAKIVNLVFLNEDKWRSVVFTWTHSDQVSKKETDNIPAVIAAFCKRVIPDCKYPPRFALTCCPPGRHPDLVGLQKEMHCGRPIGIYQMPAADEMANAINSITGFTTPQELQQLRQTVEYLRAELQRLHKAMLMPAQGSSIGYQQALPQNKGKNSITVGEGHIVRVTRLSFFLQSNDMRFVARFDPTTGIVKVKDQQWQTTFWASHEVGGVVQAPCVFNMYSTGVAQVHDAVGRLVWSTPDIQHAAQPVTMLLENVGELVIFDGAKRVLWRSSRNSWL